MKYRMKAALLAICVSACSAFGFSVYAEGSHAAAAVSDQKAGTGVNHSAEKKQGEEESHDLFPISGKTLSAFDFSVGGVSLGDSISSLSSLGTAEKVIHENTRDSYIFKI